MKQIQKFKRSIKSKWLFLIHSLYYYYLKFLIAILKNPYVKKVVTNRFNRLIFQILLFVLTLITTTLAGAEWMGQSWLSSQTLSEFPWEGLRYSIPFLAILTVHEFGHYFVARYRNCKVTLPYYLPFWLFGYTISLGTFGAVIRIRSYINNKNTFFDIGVAGPIAGFIIALGILIYGFSHLPPMAYLFSIHPSYAQYGVDFEQYVYGDGSFGIVIGKNLLFILLAQWLPSAGDWIPNMYELTHYPLLFAGYLGCFFTALNLLPVGQLDGGHTVYGILGSKAHALISRLCVWCLVFFGGLDLAFIASFSSYPYIGIPIYALILFFALHKLFKKRNHTLYATLLTLALQSWVAYSYQLEGFTGWLVFSLLLTRVLGVDHPPTEYEPKAGKWRIAWALLCLIIFILCFSPVPFQIAG